MTFYRGVISLYFNPDDSQPIDMYQQAVDFLGQQELLTKGALVVITFGDVLGEGEFTNTLKVLKY
jgi:pyruvate kinase